VEAKRSESPIKLARLHTGPFTDRLVAKFRLPVSGWRGPIEGG
ncbi:NAD kinase, partial [Geobacillus sp. MMMUD3]|nr:NAD kinase [Geobacillus sp. MMMUD3]